VEDTVKPAGCAVLLAAALATGCLRPAEDRAAADARIGQASAGGVRFAVADGLASVRAISDGELVLWAQAPVLRVELDSDANATTGWRLTLLNAMPDAQLTADGARAAIADRPRPTAITWDLTLTGSTAVLDIAPPGAAALAPYRFAYLADIQQGVDRVYDLFDRINRDPTIRFVVAGGDLINRGSRRELERVLTELEQLHVPLFSTIGNHELFGDDVIWEELIGVRNFHFAFGGVHFTLVDSGSATLDPSVYERLDDWLAAGRERVHFFITHYPPIDPIGVRQGGFRSRKEAAMLFSKLAAGGVDTVLVGHIHSYYAFEFSGIPVFVSGGGGALPAERLDGVDRHFLVVDVVPDQGVDSVGLVRID
jgi:3',5'-cyclic-AMP phosphodiesterase